MIDASPQGYYAASAGTAPPRRSLSERLSADICIVGAGYTGLSAALEAASAGARVIALEAHSVGFGASGRNGGQIHTGWRKDQQELESWLGATHARDLWDLSEEAKAHVSTLIARHAIACELKQGLIIAAHNRAAARALTHEAEHLRKAYGYNRLRVLNDAEAASEIGSSIYHGARLDRGGGHLHPLLYARGLAGAAELAGARIFERSGVQRIDSLRNGIEVITAGGSVTADKVLLATDAFSATLAPALNRFIGHIESFITATTPLPESIQPQILCSDTAVADTRHVLDYYRKSGDGRLLFAGREAYFGKPTNIAALVRPRLLRVFPQLKDIPIEYSWSGTVGITVTRMPHFGKLSDRVLFAHGYSGQGVALATLGGKLLAEAALGREERFNVVARVPARAFPGGRLIRRPLIAAGLFAFKLADMV
ncbi:MAG TPA: FAD-binding oxidoreductase [Rhizomicrobium sp.]|nr:FAD-binding oxidoreductase [Rhizomicrobium sp.]